MKRTEITSGQCVELLTLARRLTPDEYQARHRWLERVTDPSFDMSALDSVLTVTTYGREISPPFPKAKLVADVPYASPLTLTGFELLPALQGSESVIRVSEMVARNKEDKEGVAAFGCRDLDDIWAMREQITLDQWPIGVYAFAIGTVWQDANGHQYVEYVYRSSAGDWHRDCYWFDFDVSAHDRLLRRPPVKTGEASK